MINDPEIIAMNDVLNAFKGLDKTQRVRIIDWITSKFRLNEADDKSQPVEIQTSPQPQPTVIEKEQEKEKKVEKKVRAYKKRAEKEKEKEIEIEIEKEKEKEKEQVQEKGKGNGRRKRKEKKQETVKEIQPAAKRGRKRKIKETENKIEPPQMSIAQPEENAEIDTDPQKGTGLKRYKSIEALFLSSNLKTVTSKVLLAASYLQEKNNLEEISTRDINESLRKLGYDVTNIAVTLNSLIQKKPPMLIIVGKEGDSKQARRKFKVSEEGLALAKSFLKGK